MIVEKSRSQSKRVGIFAGTFNPVHGGHIALASQAGDAAALDVVYFLPERCPRGKQDVASFAHRVVMLKQALRAFPNLEVLELADATFTTERTLPKLQREFADAQLVLLVGSDIVPSLARWPKVEALLRACELVIGLRGHDRQLIEAELTHLPVRPKACIIFTTPETAASSGKVREALRNHYNAPGLLPSVHVYSRQHKLYS